MVRMTVDRPEQPAPPRGRQDIDQRRRAAKALARWINEDTERARRRACPSDGKGKAMVELGQIDEAH